VYYHRELTFEPTLPPSDDPLSPSDPIGPVFYPDDSYWMNGLQKVRFDDCKSRGIFYRHEIVKAMLKAVEDAFKKGGPAGIMIKGPHGICKSHSLVNLVRTLQYDSRCKYLVTFIPDYEKWKDLYTLICSSFGTSLSALLWSSSSGLVSQSKRHYTFVIAMDLILRGMKKKWVLVFDQINRLFTRFVTKAASQIYLGCSLSFPFDVIFNMMQGDHIFSIVPASAKNEATYKERHSGFEEYNHLQHGFGRNQARL